MGLQIGFTVNIIVAIVAVYGSFLVIFFSDDSLDMVLNSVALFFIVELDDMLVRQSDYERIAEYIGEIRDMPQLERRRAVGDEYADSLRVACRKCCRMCCAH